MKTFKRLFVLALTLVLVVGCSSNNGEKEENKDILTEITEPVTITFWHAMNAAQEEALTKLVNDFMAENKNITVELQNQSKYDALNQKLTSTYAIPDSLPNLTQAYPGWIYDAAQDGLVEPIRPYIDNEKIGISDYDTDVVESFRKSGVIEDVEYGIPFNKSTEAVFINKTMFDAAGLEIPTTLDEFAAAAKTLTEKNPGIVGAGFDSLNNYFSQSMFEKGQVFDSSIDPASTAGKEVISYYLDGIKAGYFRIAGSDDYLNGPLAAEDVAFYVGSTAGEKYVTKGVDGKFEVVAGKSPYSTGLQQGTDIYMFSKGTPEQKTASFLLMKYLTTAESTLYFAQNTGYLPVRTSVLKGDEYKNSGGLIAPIADEITANMFSLPVVKNADSAYNMARTQMEAILANPDGVFETQVETFKTELADAWAQ